MYLYGSVGLLDFNIWINQNRRKPNLSILCTMRGGKDGSISQIAQGCQPGTRQIFKVGTLGYQNQLKKKLNLKKRFSPKSSFLCRTIWLLR